MNHYSIFGFKLKIELQEIYLAEFFRKMAITLYGFYVPVFLYQKSELGLVAVILYFMGGNGLNTIFNLLVGEIISRKGTRFTMFVGGLLHLPYFLCLIFLPQRQWLLLFVIMLNSLRNSFTWVGLQTDMTIEIAKKNTAYYMSIFKVIQNFSQIIAPILSAYIIVAWGYNWIFAIAIILISIYTILTLLLGEISPKYDFKTKVSIKKTWQTLKSDSTGILNTLEGFNNLLVNLWPLYLFLTLENIKSVGWLSSLALLTLAILAMNISKHIDKNPAKIKKYISRGLIFEGFGWLGKAFFVNMEGLFPVDTGSKISHEYVVNSLNKINFEKIWPRDATESYIIRLNLYNLGVFCATIILLILAAFTDAIWTLRIGIIILAICNIVIGTVLRRK